MRSSSFWFFICCCSPLIDVFISVSDTCTIHVGKQIKTSLNYIATGNVSSSDECCTACLNIIVCMGFTFFPFGALTSSDPLCVLADVIDEIKDSLNSTVVGVRSTSNMSTSPTITRFSVTPPATDPATSLKPNNNGVLISMIVLTLILCAVIVMVVGFWRVRALRRRLDALKAAEKMKEEEARKLANCGTGSEIAVLSACVLFVLPHPAVYVKGEMVDLKQSVDVLDYFGALVVFCLFFIIVFIICVTCILWFCVSDEDDVTVFSKFKGRKRQQYNVDQQAKAL